MKYKSIIYSLIALSIFSIGMVTRIETAYSGAKQEQIMIQQKIDSLTAIVANASCK